MKKILLKSMLFLSAFVFSANLSAQFTEGFEGGATAPPGWTVINNGSAEGWEFGAPPSGSANTGLNTVFIEFGSVAHDDFLVTPQITVTANTSDLLKFYAKNRSSSFIEEFNILISTTGNAVGDFTVTLDGPIAPPTTWNEYVYDLSAYIGQDIYISFQAISTNEFGLYLDDISIEGIPTCPQPSVLAQTAITSSSVDVDWTENGSATTWNIEVGPTGFTPGTSTEVTADNGNTTQASSLSGLADNTSYDVYVQADCGPGDQSIWEGPLTITTPPAVQIPVSTFPWNEDFEAGGSEWTILNGTQVNQWFVGTAINNGGTNSLYVSDDGGTSHNYDNGESSATFAYRDITMPASYASAILSFDWLCDGESSSFSSYDFLSVWAVPTSYNLVLGTELTASGTAPTGVIDLTNVLGEELNFQTGTFQIPTAYAGQTFRLVFQWENDGSGGQNPPAVVDNVNITTYNCLAPSGLVATNVTTDEATVSWDDNTAGAPNFTVEYGPAGFTPGTGTTVAVATDTFVVLTGLMQDQDYEYYVSAECGDGTFSQLSNVDNFATLIACDPVTNLSLVDVTTSTVELTWSAPVGYGDFVVEYGPVGFTPGTGTQIAAPPTVITGLDDNTEYDFYVYSDCGGGSLSQPEGPVNVTTPATCLVPTDLIVSEIGADSSVVAWTENGSATNWVIEYDTVGFTIGTGMNISTTDNPDTLTGLNPEYSYDVYVWADCGLGDLSDTLGPIAFTTEAACPTPTNLTVSEIGADSSVVAWTQTGGAATNWVIEYDTVGFTLGSGMNMPTMDNPDTLTGLSPEYSYDVYVWADCGADGVSDTLGPIDFTTQPTCLAPTNFNVDLYSATNAEVTWDENGTATDWNIEYGIAPFTQGSGTFVNGATNPDTISIVGDEDYQVYVQSQCSTSDSSVWAGPFDFDTRYCDVTSSSANYWIESFSTSQGITNISNDSTGAGSPVISYSNFTALSASGFEGQTIGFTVEANNLNSTYGVGVWVDWNDNFQFDAGESVFSTGGYQNMPITGAFTVPNGAAVGDHRLRVVLNWLSGSPSACGSTYGEGEDYTFTVVPVPSCLPVTDIAVTGVTTNSGDIAWTENGSATAWNIEYGPVGFTQGSGTLVTGVSNPTTITGLTDNTEYDVYVQADCGSGDESVLTSTSFFTSCSSFDALGFCEGFEFGTSLTLGCWRSLDVNNDGDAWEVSTTNPNTGDYAASIYTDFNSGNNDDYLISPALNLTGDEAMKFFYRVQSASEPNEYQVLLSTTGSQPADFQDTLMQLASYSNTTYNDTVIDLSMFTGTVYVAFHIPAASSIDGWRLFIDDVCFGECIPTPGQDGSVDVCRLDGSVDLEDGIITTNNNSGRWEYPANQALIQNDTMFNIASLPSGTHDVLYIVEGICQPDTTVASINVYGASSAGNGMTISVCKNEPINLYAALSGNVDIGGDWYDFNGNLLPNSQPTSPGLQAQYNYTYIVSNGICPADTALVEVNVGNCVWVGLEEELFTDITVYPNPTSSILNIVNPSNTSSLKVEMIDMNGRVVLVENSALNNASEATFAIDHLEKGIYTLRVYNDEGQKIFKIVKQ
jgi:hypothetical protein